MIPIEFLGAFKAGHIKAVRPFIDEELPTKLLKKVLKGCERSRETLAYITKFNNEYYKNVIKKGDPDALHADDDLRRETGRRKYAARMDVFSRYDLVYIGDQKKFR